METDINIFSASKTAGLYDHSIIFKRWKATMIDSFIFAGLFLSSLGFFISTHSDGPNIFEMILSCLNLALFAVYYLVLEAFSGYTIGKFILRIRVAKEDGKAPGFGKNLIRTLMRFIELNPVTGGTIAAIVVLTSNKRQRLGDMLAQTYVLEADDLPSEELEGIKKFVVLSITTLTIISFVIGVLNFMAGDGGIIGAIERSTSQSEPTKMVVVDSEIRYQISFPIGWYLGRTNSELDKVVTSFESDKIVTLKGINDSTDSFVIGSTYKKHDILSISTHCDISKTSLQSLLKNPIFGEYKKISINGMEAIQYSATGKLDNKDASVLETIIKGKKAIYYLMLVTTASSNQTGIMDGFMNFIQTFAELKR